MSCSEINRLGIKARIRSLVRDNPKLRPAATFGLATFYKSRTLLSRLTRRRVIARYLSEQKTRGLHLGCGANLHLGWLNTDLQVSWPGTVFLDATKTFPLPDGSMDHVFSEHMIEHVGHGQGLRLLHEAFRVLKPGGRIRIATPNLETLLELHSREAGADADEYMTWFATRNMAIESAKVSPALVINHFFYNWDHRFIYNRATLEASFCEAGFTDLEWCAVGQSPKPELQNLERHGAALGSERWNAYETMILEGFRP